MANVLVVDDLAESAETLAAILIALGHRVDVAHDGRQALAACDETKPDVVIMDLDMPVMDGYAAARAMRGRRPCDPRLLVALTGEPRAQAEPRALASGFDIYLQKPADLPALLAMIPS